MVLCAAGQQVPNQKPIEQQSPPREPAQPQPGPIVEPMQPPNPDELPPEEDAQSQDYGGPAILSRGGGPSVGRGGELVRMRPFVTLEGVYDTALATTSLNRLGDIPFADAYGMQLGFGVMGTHTWRRSLLDLDYRGNFRHYNRKTYYDGMDNTLALNFRHRASRRVTIGLSEMASRYQRGFILPFALRVGDTMVNGVSSGDLFDTPTNLVMTGGQLAYQATARLSFSMGGSGFLMSRRSQALIGAVGASAIGDVAYRLGRYQTIGVQYDFSHYDYQRQFGSADIHGAAVNYSVRIGRRWELALRGGAYRVEVLRLQKVSLDPVIAAILGRGVGIETFHRIVQIPRYDVRLARSFRRSSLHASYGRAVLPGNGIYMTSGGETLAFGYSYSGIRRAGIHFSGGYNTYSSLAQTLGKFRTYDGSTGFTYKLTRTLSLVAAAYARQATILKGSFDRTMYRATLGIAWAPGDYPLALW